MNPIRHVASFLIALAAVVLAMPAAAGTPRIGFSSKTVGFQLVNTRNAGTFEYAMIYALDANGVVDMTIPVTVVSSDVSLMKVSPVQGNALGNYQLTVPANAANGEVTVTASATIAGKPVSRARNFTIVAATPPPPPPPSGTPTTARASVPTVVADQSGCASIQYYDVGPGQVFQSLGQLPWSLLKGCDTVRIHAKANNAPYNEMILISAGTNLAPTAPNKFMRVVGVPDPVTGARPIIDGTNATQLETLPGQAPRSLRYHDNNGGRALYRLGPVMVGPQLGYDYNFGPAGYIEIGNLDIRNAFYGVSFTDASTGMLGQYDAFASCIFVEAAAHLLVRNNLLHGCGNGLFINSKNSTVLELSQDVLVEGNQLYNNSNAPLTGVSNGFSEHNSYSEARDIIFQYNYFGDVRPGAFGDCLKDRSSGLIVRYNTFASTCGLFLNLVDSTGGQGLIWGDAGYAKTYVYGNLFDVTPGPQHYTNLIAYGGDSGMSVHYRQGTLFYYNNTLSVTGDAGNGIYPETLLFGLLMPTAVADVRNNVFQATPSTLRAPGKVQAMVYGTGTVNMKNNWVSPNAAQYWAGHLTGALVNGWSSNLGAGNNPKFMNAALHDFRTAAGSPLINQGDSLLDLDISLFPLYEPGSAGPRKQNGALDIGAFEY